MLDFEQELLDFVGQPSSIVEYLDSLSFDELVEIDLFNNRIRNLFHVDGKYFVPVFDGSYKDLYRYGSENMIHPDDRSVHKEFMNHDTILERLEKSSIPGVISEEFRYRLQSGGWCWVKQVIIGGSQFGLDEGVIRFYVFDIQNRKQRELGNVAIGQHNATSPRDRMTGLPRENDFFALARERLESQDSRDWCLVSIDIDQFKLFNDWYGREAGDYVLAKIGGMLVQREINENWLAGYLGQDDFCAFMPFSEEGVKELYIEISSIIASYGTNMTFTPVFGVYVIENDSAILDVFDRAKIAAYKAKGDFKHRISYFEPKMFEQTDAEYRILTDFQKAVENDEIFYVLQPQCRLSSGQIVGAEALARWKKVNGEIVEPDDFIPVLEKYGFITDLDRYIWEDVCKNLHSWIRSGHTPVPISVNVSRRDIFSIDVAEHFTNLLARYGLPSSLIRIEITETAYVDDTGLVDKTVQRLRDNGFVVLIDDFGSGYSSLNMLDNVNVDVIKLDMCFLRMNDSDKQKSIRILESTISMAKALGMAVITEGVETKEQADFLRSIGCRYVQGYYLYRPMTYGDFEKIILDEDLIDRNGFLVKTNDEFRLREFLDKNVYSDSMLNSLLGAVAVYSWNGDDVDIVRFNEQFYEEMGIENLENYLSGNQAYVEEHDRERYFGLLKDAMEDELNGATDVIRYRRVDGAPIDCLMHFYYLGEFDGCRRFYCTVRNMTQITEMREELRLVSRIERFTVAFLKHYKNDWHFRLAIHGLVKEFGMSRSSLEEELESRVFFDRVEGEAGNYLRALSYQPDDKLGDFCMPLNIRTNTGEIIKTTLSSYYVEEARCVFSYVLVLRMR